MGEGKSFGSSGILDFCSLECLWGIVGQRGNILRVVKALQAKMKVDRCVQQEDSQEENEVFLFLFFFLEKVTGKSLMPVKCTFETFECLRLKLTCKCNLAWKPLTIQARDVKGQPLQS